MNEAEPVPHIPPGARHEGDPTPGMTSGEAIVVDGMWAGFVRTAPGSTAGRHHHGDHESHLVVVRAGQGAPTVDVDGPAPA